MTIHTYPTNFPFYAKLTHGVYHVPKGGVLAEVKILVCKKDYQFTHFFNVFLAVLLFLFLSYVVYAGKTVYYTVEIKRSKIII